MSVNFSTQRSKRKHIVSLLESNVQVALTLSVVENRQTNDRVTSQQLQTSLSREQRVRQARVLDCRAMSTFRHVSQRDQTDVIDVHRETTNAASTSSTLSHKRYHALVACLYVHSLYDSRVATIAKSIDVLIENITNKMFVIEITDEATKKVVAKVTNLEKLINRISASETTRANEKKATKIVKRKDVDKIAIERRENITTRTFVIQESKRREDENAKTTARIWVDCWFVNTSFKSTSTMFTYYDERTTKVFQICTSHELVDESHKQRRCMRSIKWDLLKLNLTFAMTLHLL